MTKTNSFAAFAGTDDQPATPAAAPLARAGDRLSAAERKEFRADAVRETFFALTTADRAEGVAAVQSRGKIGHDDYSKTAYLQLPIATNRLIDAAIVGPKAPALVALIEYALMELARKKLTLIVNNGDEWHTGKRRN